MSRRRFLRRLRPVLLATVALVTAAVGVAAYLTGLLEDPELATVNARFSVRGPDPAPRNLVVVGIDDVTFGDLGLRWPFPRSVHAVVIDRLRHAGAHVIAYDVQFTEPSPGRARYCPFVHADAAPADCALVTAAGQARNLVFSTTEADTHGRSGVLGGPDSQRALHAAVGNGIVPADADGSTRRVPYSVDGLKSFAVTVAERATGRPVRARGFARDGTQSIAFRGPPGTIPEISLSHVLAGRFARDYFRDKIVVVGAVAPTLKDVFHTATSASQLMSGPELQASAIDTALRGFPLRHVPTSVDLALIILLGFLVPLTSLWVAPLRALSAAFVLGGVFVLAVQLAFDSGSIVALVCPLVTLLASAAGSLLVHYFTETRERRRTRLLFARFVPEEVVDQVLACADDDLRLGAVQREGTVMFSDLRGFTSFAEALPVERVIEVLNRYLGEMSAAILDNGGTLVAYMGDGIMAVFGAPIEQDDHADRALAAAREMLGARLGRFNDYLRREGLSDGFGMGIGVSSGHVMSGNVGSERRLEYTAIGDTTNTAARLEAMTKGTPHQIFIADATRSRLRKPAEDLVALGEFEVRGRQQRIRLWSLAGEAGDAALAGTRAKDPVPA